MKNLCWFVSGYFFTYSFEFSNKISLKDLKMKDSPEDPILKTFLNGEIEFLKDEPYDFDLVISNYFIPFLLWNEKFEILQRIPSHFFNFPFKPRNIFRDPEIFSRFILKYNPLKVLNEMKLKGFSEAKLKCFKEFDGMKISKIFRKDSFLFIISENHAGTFIKINRRIFKLI